MNPDGPEQREAEAQERSWREVEELDLLEDKADSDLMAISDATTQERMRQDLIDVSAARVADLEAYLRDIIFGCDGMLQPAMRITGAMRGFITEVKRVATAGLKS
jgi:hypothetical protein